MAEPVGPHLDDDSVPADATLWRRVPPWPDYITHDASIDRVRPSSLAFDDDEMSAHVAEELASVDEITAGHAGFGVVAIRASLLRELGQAIVRNAGPGAGRAHVLVCGHKTKSLLKRVARESVWVVLPSAGA